MSNRNVCSMQTLNAPAIHLPLSQSTNNAHVANERLRINNLIVGVQVMRTLFADVGSSGLASQPTTT